MFTLQEIRKEVKRTTERTMSICLTWVSFCELGEPKLYHNLEDFTRMRDITWRVSDCEGLVGVTHRR